MNYFDTYLIFRDFGFGKSNMEELIREEILQFMNHLEPELNQPISLSNKFNISVINGLWTIMTGKRYNLVRFCYFHLIGFSRIILQSSG